MKDVTAILAGLDPEQTAIAQAVGGPVVVIAGAGTGKTRALTHRIAYAVATEAVQAGEVLALTFTTKAAGEMRHRLAELGVRGVQARTFHSAALRQARFFYPQISGQMLPPIREKALPLVAEAANRVGIAKDTARLRDLAAEISWSKTCNVRIDRYCEVAALAGRAVAGVAHEQVTAVMSAYEAVKHRAGVIDLDDILLVTVALLVEHPKVAEQVRATYRHLLVDEYQDVSPIQQTLIKAWLGSNQEIMVVGDPAQAIHGFAGADPRFLLNFTDEFPAARRFSLTRNYRSSATIVAQANDLAARSPAQVPAVKLQPQLPKGPKVEVMKAENLNDEVNSLVTWLKERQLTGTSFEDMAVLYRVNSQSVPVEAALAEAGLPYTVRGAERFYQRPEVRVALANWRGLASSRPDDLARDGLRDALTGLGWTAEAPAGHGQQRERWESWQALAQLAEALPIDQTITQAMAEIEHLVEDQQAPDGPGIVLSSLHASKGLEFEVVAIIGVQEGLLPFSLSTTPEQLAEENRLLYVGLTRAKQWLRLSWDSSRRQASRFLGRQDFGQGKPSSTGVKKQAKPKSMIRNCRVCNQALLIGADIKLGRHAGCPSSFDEILLAELKAWRLEEAKADQVPAFVIFSDTTLIAIAEAMPKSAQALLNVSGVGPTKLQRYGQAVLALIKQH